MSQFDRIRAHLNVYAENKRMIHVYLSTVCRGMVLNWKMIPVSNESKTYTREWSVGKDLWVTMYLIRMMSYERHGISHQRQLDCLFNSEFRQRPKKTQKSLHWRHNGHDCVSNHQPHQCLLNRFQRKHQSSAASLAFVWGNHRGPVNSPHKRPVTQKMFPLDDVIIFYITGLLWENGLIMWNAFVENVYLYSVCVWGGAVYDYQKPVIRMSW